MQAWGMSGHGGGLRFRAALGMLPNSLSRGSLAKAQSSPRKKMNHSIASPTLYIFSGLPGVGKSTLARRLAGRLGCAYVRIDTIEQALRELCAFSVQGEGYWLAYRVAADSLKAGLSVIADCCNPIELTRTEWEEVARACGAGFVNDEIQCSDKAEHRRRVETRESEVPGLKLPTWPEVEGREYHSWTRPRVVVDTAGKSVGDAFNQLCRAVLH